MGLFKDVKKPVIRQATRGAGDITPLRPRFVAKQPPCSGECPAGVDVRGWLTSVAQAEALGRGLEDTLEAAWHAVTVANPFPATLGRICPHPCERACHRNGKDGSVAINDLERLLGDFALARGLALERAANAAPPSARIAVVGAGPAGLSCAYHLARRGYRVVLFEGGDVAGGRLRDATRTGRLPAPIVDREIARLIALGIELRCNLPVARDLGLLPADYDAVFVAVGRRRSGETVNIDDRGRSDRDRVFAGGDAVRPGLVSGAILSGRRAADSIDVTLGGQPAASAAPPGIAAGRLKLGWYASAPRTDRPAPAGDDLASGQAPPGRAAQEWLVAEARRCLSCGFCMDCEQCWMFCTNNCFEKLPRGQHYKLAVDGCNGCRKCADECPCGYIDMV